MIKTIFICFVIMGFTLILINCQGKEYKDQWVSFRAQIESLESGSSQSEEDLKSVVAKTMEALRNRFQLFNISKVEIKVIEGQDNTIEIKMPQKDIIVKGNNLKLNLSPKYLTAYICAYQTYNIELKLCTFGPTQAKEEIIDGYYAGQFPEDMEIHSQRVQTWKIYYSCYKEAVVSSKDFKHAEEIRDQFGEPAVQFELKPDAAERLKKLTANNTGKHLAILLDGRIIMAPRIETPFSSPVVLSGHLNPTFTRIMSVLMKAGPLPAHLVLPARVKLMDTNIKITIHVGKDNSGSD